MLDVRPWAKTEDQHSIGENCGGKAHFFFFRDSIQSMKTNAEWLDFFRPERMPSEEKCQDVYFSFQTER